jgi:hypothetical protein
VLTVESHYCLHFHERNLLALEWYTGVRRSTPSNTQRGCKPVMLTDGLAPTGSAVVWPRVTLATMVVVPGTVSAFKRLVIQKPSLYGVLESRYDTLFS